MPRATTALRLAYAALAASDRLSHTTCLVSEPVTDLTALAALRLALDDLVAAGVIDDRKPVVRMEDHWSLLAIADIARLTPTGRSTVRKATKAVSAMEFAITGLDTAEQARAYDLLRSLRRASGDFPA